MSRKPLQQVPLVVEDRLCPFCNRIANRKDFKVILRDSNNEPATVTLRILQCKNCKIPLAVKSINKRIQKIYGTRYISTFEVKSTDTIKDVLKRTTKRPDETTTISAVKNCDNKSIEKTMREGAYIDSSDEAQKKLNNVPGSLMLVRTSNKEHEIDEFFITENTHVSQMSSHVIIYSCSLARELLTAAFHEDRHLAGEYEGTDFTIKSVTYRESEGINKLTTEEVSIKQGGGMHRRSSNQSESVVDLLVYSPYIDRFEILRATYDPVGNRYYTDISLYREFVDKYGKPPIDVHFAPSDNSANGWNSLQPESVLKEYGYNVSATDGFTDQYRQKLLAEIVDLELLSVSHISHLLNFFITSHPARNYEQARGKWKRDKYFIENYRVNPSRFLILKK